jgi:hypothetical protein
MLGKHFNEPEGPDEFSPESIFGDDIFEILPAEAPEKEETAKDNPGNDK